LNEPLLGGVSVTDWKTALQLVVERWKGPGKLVLALDEFQWMAEASKELCSVIQELWDREWQRAGKVMLLLCGSYLGFMEREVLGKRSPLYGRRTAQILLSPFGFREAAEFHPSYSRVEQAKAYFICGGVPLYLKTLSAKRSIEQNIVASFTDEFGTLFREPEFLLREELRELSVYHSILLALASGRVSVTEIARAARLDARKLPYYLQHLLNLGYVARRYPLHGAKVTARQVRYSLDDPLLRFWFRFVFPHMSVMRSLGPEKSFQELIKPDLESYFGICFESLCREAMALIYKSENVSAAFEVGEYWNAELQVDVVGLREDDWIDIGECKWGPHRSAPALLKELDAKVKGYPNPRNSTMGRIVFTKDPTKLPANANARNYSLEELYGL
jgi:AAA+ ATPase superfamily predicted ATPase